MLRVLLEGLPEGFTIMLSMSDVELLMNAKIKLL